MIIHHLVSYFPYNIMNSSKFSIVGLHLLSGYISELITDLFSNMSSSLFSPSVCLGLTFVIYMAEREKLKIRIIIDKSTFTSYGNGWISLVPPLLLLLFIFSHVALTKSLKWRLLYYEALVLRQRILQMHAASSHPCVYLLFAPRTLIIFLSSTRWLREYDICNRKLWSEHKISA